ncbi:hypothetical protein ACN082_03450 [Rothia sp. CCM 9417]|uniref:hypothetical protein n=1 Tax=Rothia sp. CCM 9417 TaxID=3402657 RepID=UPI003ADB44D8
MSLLTAHGVKAGTSLALLLAVALTGCKPQPQNFQELEPEQANPEHITALESLMYPPEGAEKARRAFVERCVAQAGGKYLEPVAVHSLDHAVYTGRTTDELKANGYGPLPAQSDRATASFDQAGLDAYLGKGDSTLSVSFMDYSSGELKADGCMAQSYEYLYGSVENGIKAALLAPQFGSAIADSLRSDEKYVELQRQWASCMSDAGFGQVKSTDLASYQASLVGQADAKKMLEADISCRERHSFDSSVSELKNSYYESVYKRLKQFKDELEAIHATSQERVEADKADPKNTSPVTLPTPSESASASAEPTATAS